MPTFNLVIAAVLLANAAAGLVLVGRGRTVADRLIVVNLMGTTSVIAILLVGTAAGMAAADDVALVAAMLAPFSSLTFARRLWWRSPAPAAGRPPGGDEGGRNVRA
ncbi:monovalent cation/H+ antiporter complex subunit F [Azospirillum sp. ST 5-10]|uniref:monovalent cation/H+ antiporter complex subunit F n=1 Tax=unclassified Azospirillum TaxID=2630922 RepID=UPI003F4A45ED